MRSGLVRRSCRCIFIHASVPLLPVFGDSDFDSSMQLKVSIGRTWMELTFERKVNMEVEQIGMPTFVGYHTF